MKQFNIIWQELKDWLLFTNIVLLHLSYIKGGIQAKGIWKQDHEASIWAQEGWEWGVEKAPQWGIS